MVTDGVPTPSEQCVQEKQDRIAHANDKGGGKNSVQDVRPREAAMMEILSGKAIPFAQQCVALDVQKLWDLCNYSVAFACPTKGRHICYIYNNNIG